MIRCACKKVVDFKQPPVSIHRRLLLENGLWSLLWVTLMSDDDYEVWTHVNLIAMPQVFSSASIRMQAACKALQASCLRCVCCGPQTLAQRVARLPHVAGTDRE